MLSVDQIQDASPLVFASRVFWSVLWICVISRKMMVIHLKFENKKITVVQYKEVMSSIQTLSSS